MKAPTLAEIAKRINAYLDHFEHDPVINAPYKYKEMSLRHYWNAGASRAGRYVGVRYVSYQCTSNLTREQALQYLAWLEAGNVGNHYQALKKAACSTP